MKEIEKPTTHLVQRLHRVSSEKVIEKLWERLWKEIKNWSYQKGKMMEEAQNIIASTILSYMNVPLMDNFVRTKDIIA